MKRKRHEQNRFVRKTLKEILVERPEYRVEQIKSKLGLLPRGNKVANILKEHKRHLLKQRKKIEGHESESSIDSLINVIQESREKNKSINSRNTKHRLNFSLDLDRIRQKNIERASTKKTQTTLVDDNKERLNIFSPKKKPGPTPVVVEDHYYDHVKDRIGHMHSFKLKETEVRGVLSENSTEQSLPATRERLRVKPLNLIPSSSSSANKPIKVVESIFPSSLFSTPKPRSPLSPTKQKKVDLSQEFKKYLESKSIIQDLKKKPELPEHRRPKAMKRLASIIDFGK